jgi:predicted hotdog family 3-hydroxylacyl-ACP dehydratase
MDPVSYLPHGKEIVAIAEIIETTPNSIVCQARGGTTAFHFIESCAQAAAVGRILSAGEQEPRFGVILRIKEFSSSHFKVDQDLQVSCSWSEAVGNVYEVVGQAQACKEDQVCARVVMTLMEFQ